MNEATLVRILRQYRKVRGQDFHQPATRDAKGNIERVDGIHKRLPLSKEERAEAEKSLALIAAGGAGPDAAAEDATASKDVVEPGDARELIDPADFFRVFDAWVDSKYPGDRGSATKVKVAFRKQHRTTVSNLCLEDIEEIAQAMR